MTGIITPKRLKIASAIVAVAATGVVAAMRFPGTSNKTQSYITAPVTVSDLREEVLASGTLKPARLTAVGAQVSGRITALNVRVGDTVKAGDVIAQIDPVTKQNDLRSSEASLKNYRAQKVEKEAALVLAEANLARQQATLAQRATSRSDFDSADSTVRQTRAQIAALEALIVGAEASVETARVNLEYTRITAPIDGTVLATVAQEGQTVNAVQSAPTIVVLGQLETMTVRAEISETDIVKVKPGQSLYFTILGDPGPSLRGPAGADRAGTRVDQDRRQLLLDHHVLVQLELVELDQHGDLLHRRLQRPQQGLCAADLHDRRDSHRHRRGEAREGDPRAGRDAQIRRPQHRPHPQRVR